MAEQNFHQAIRIADRGYIIVHGEIVFEGGVAELEQNELVKNYYLGQHERFLAFLLLAVSLNVCSQDYPNRPVRMLVGYPPGGGDGRDRARDGAEAVARRSASSSWSRTGPAPRAAIAAEALVALARRRLRADARRERHARSLPAVNPKVDLRPGEAVRAGRRRVHRCRWRSW